MFDWLTDPITSAAKWVGNKISNVGSGLFDTGKGIMQSGASNVTDFGGGAFAAVDERARGGKYTTTSRAPVAQRIGGAVGNIFGDIAESYIKGKVSAALPTTGMGEAPLYQGPAIDYQTGRARKPKARARAAPAGSGEQPFQALLGQLQPPSYAGFTPSTGMSLVEPSADSPLARYLVDQAVSLIPGDVREGLYSAGQMLGVFPEEGASMSSAVALPGGAAIGQSPAVIPTAGGTLSGRVYNVRQNLVTGALSVTPKQTIRYMNPVTGNIDRYERAIPYGLKVRGKVISTGRKRCSCRKR